jgi:hypothetical protein
MQRQVLHYAARGVRDSTLQCMKDECCETNQPYVVATNVTTVWLHMVHNCAVTYVVVRHFDTNILNI